MDANGGEQETRRRARRLFPFARMVCDGKQVAFVRGVYHPGTLDVEPQLEILDLASNERRVVLKTRLGPAWPGLAIAWYMYLRKRLQVKMIPIFGR